MGMSQINLISLLSIPVVFICDLQTMPAMHATAPPAYTSDVQVSSLSEKVDLNIPAYNDKSYDPPNYDELSRA